MTGKPKIEMTAVTSSNVVAVGYDPAAPGLLVEFKGGRHYLYRNVPQELFDRLLRAESKGKFINQNIKPTFPVEKVA